MPEDPLKKEIQDHLASFPERRKDYAEMREEWDDLKSKAFWICVGSLGVLIGYGVWVGTMQTKQEQLRLDLDRSVTIAREAEERLGSLEVNNSGIQARLTSIDATLQEIKVAIRQLNY